MHRKKTELNGSKTTTRCQKNDKKAQKFFFIISPNVDLKFNEYYY